MRVLIDTHALLWVSAGDDRLSNHARHLMEDLSNDVVVSVVTAWEIAIKYSLGRMPELGDEAPERWVPSRVAQYSLSTLDISFAHTFRVARLPQHHRDPFDRMLIAQAQEEALPVITNDTRFAHYGVELIW